MSYVALNNAKALLTGSVAIGAVSLPITTGKGSLFVVGSDHSYVTIESASTSEVVKLTGVTGDSLTVVATTKAWNIGDVVECRPCSQAMADYMPGPQIHGASAKTTPVDADTLPLIDSAASNVLKKVTWANIKATLKAYFDTLYATVAQVHYIGTTSIAANRASEAQTLTGVSIDGNAATATTAEACSGNAATATLATTAESCSGNAATATSATTAANGGVTSVNGQTGAVTVAVGEPTAFVSASYNSGTGVLTFTRANGGTLDVSGFYVYTGGGVS
jgi:hypothetical protein